MATELLQAELALAELAEHFDHWRRNRATAQERIPPALWDQAVVLTSVLPRSQVAKRLRLSPTDLKKQCLARPTAISSAGASPATVAAGLTPPTGPPAIGGRDGSGLPSPNNARFSRVRLILVFKLSGRSPMPLPNIGFPASPY